MGDRCTTRCHAGVSAPLWTIGWLFTIGFLRLAFWKAVLAILIWPWYLGSALAAAGGN
ncbi:MAG TPA: hypothetical protein P5266_00620 [Candidatus Fermentibacter sp.]|nr:hypothetical protein [Candidatus Fermentibacter sp.]HRY60669.1 hypothetical protein [Candidatus Fermentibacter sp.]